MLKTDQLFEEITVYGVTFVPMEQLCRIAIINLCGGILPKDLSMSPISINGGSATINYRFGEEIAGCFGYVHDTARSFSLKEDGEHRVVDQVPLFDAMRSWGFYLPSPTADYYIKRSTEPLLLQFAGGHLDAVYLNGWLSAMQTSAGYKGSILLSKDNPEAANTNLNFNHFIDLPKIAYAIGDYDQIVLKNKQMGAYLYCNLCQDCSDK